MSSQRAKAKPQVRHRILIVDDHPITRYGMSQLFQLEPDLEVCGEAEDATQAISLLPVLRPDLVVCDLTLPGKHGLECLKDVQALFPDLAVLVVSMHDEEFYAERVLRAGGRGYLMKQAGGEELIRAVREVLGGRIYLSKRMSENALHVFSGRHSKSALPTRNLTDREFQVFQCLGQGMTSREIGAALHMGRKTVETHRRHVREKLALKSSPDLIKYAVRWMASQPAG